MLRKQNSIVRIHPVFIFPELRFTTIREFTLAVWFEPPPMYLGPEYPKFAYAEGTLAK